MIQYTEIVYVNEIDYEDGDTACYMDAFVVTTYLGNHTVACEVKVFGEDHSFGVVVPRRDVRGASDLYVLHQKVMADFLRETGAEYIDLDYRKYERFISKFH